MRFCKSRMATLLDSTLLNKRTDPRRLDHGGFTLIESIFAVVVVSLIIGTSIAGLNTLTNVSSGANDSARVAAIVNAYGQAIKAVPYKECAEPAHFQNALDGLDAGSLTDEKMIRTFKAGNYSAEVLAVENLPACPKPLSGVGAIDSGTQKISYRVTRERDGDEKVRTAVVTKLDPDAAPGLPHAIIDQPVLTTTPGDVIASYSFTATASFGEKYPIVRWEWNCDGRNESPAVAMDFGTPSVGPDTVAAASRGRDVTSDNDANVKCVFTASSAGPTTHTMSLFVYDGRGQVSTEAVATVTVAQAVTSRLPPIAVATPTPATATAGTAIAFSSLGSRSPDGDIASYSWDFKDATSGSSNASSAPNPTHTFYQPGVYDVVLTVTDDVGAQATDIAQVTIAAPAVPLPTARFTAPSPLVAPTRATFNGSASTTGTGGAPSVYTWTFSDGGSATGAVVNHDFMNPGTFLVTLTVEDSAGRSASTTGTVVVVANVAPLDFRVVATRAYIPCLFFGCPGARTGYFDFGWTNGPRSPGDTTTHEIKVTILQGCVAWADQTRTYTPTAVGSWQVVRWEESTTNPFDFSTQICAGSVYNYMMRVKRVNSLGTFYSSWSPTQRVTI